MSNNNSSLSKDATRVTSNSGNDEHGTPIPFIRKLKEAVGGSFSLDPCSGAEPHPIAKNTFTKDDNGLAKDWFGTVYVNPPYSALETWLKKVVGEHNRSDDSAPETIICLLPAYTSANWFQKYATQADLLSLVDGRMSFHGSDNQATFHSVLVAFGTVTKPIATAFDTLGTIYTRVQVEHASEQQRLDDLFQTDGGATAASATNTVTSNTTQQSSLGPTIRDLAQTATPQSLLNFTSMSVGDNIFVEMDTSMMGFPDEIPETMHTQVLSGAPATSAPTQTPDKYNTLLCIHQDTETYLCLYQNPNTPTDIRVSAAPNGHGWIDLRLKTIQRTETSFGPNAATYVDNPALNP